VLRTFEFVSQLRRSSVIVKDASSLETIVFVKGAPECIRHICLSESRECPIFLPSGRLTLIPLSVPADYDELLNYYTYGGYRVIACATKILRPMPWYQLGRMSRLDAESDLTFVGFIIFENKLKPSTTGVISELHAANIRSVMCTGDNILTAVSVARECGLVRDGSQCFAPYFLEGKLFVLWAEILMLKSKQGMRSTRRLGYAGRARTISAFSWTKTPYW
jgi:cation-transporting ATPase 13A3/4/5